MPPSGASSAKASDYTKVKRLGAGAFGEVFLVKLKATGRQYVIKEVSVQRMPQRERDAAIAEAKVLRAFDHPNICHYKDFFVDVGKLHIVMGYAENGDLYGAVKKQRGKKFAEEQVLDWFVQICLALKHVHDRKVLHRDIKTQNIMLADGGKRILLGDFGIAKVFENTRDLARTQVGTPYYLSPEICADKAYDNRSDVWSLGCVLYELMTLKHAFDANSMHALVLKIMRGKPPPISSVYSSELRKLVGEMLMKNPKQRPTVNQVRPATRFAAAARAPAAAAADPRRWRRSSKSPSYSSASGTFWRTRWCSRSSRTRCCTGSTR